MPPRTATIAPPHWLVDLNIGGRIYRYSDVELEVVDQAGRTLIYHGGLESDPTVSRTYGKGSPSRASIQIVDCGAEDRKSVV